MTTTGIPTEALRSGTVALPGEWPWQVSHIISLIMSRIAKSSTFQATLPQRKKLRPVMCVVSRRTEISLFSMVVQRGLSFSDGQSHETQSRGGRQIIFIFSKASHTLIGPHN